MIDRLDSKSLLPYELEAVEPEESCCLTYLGSAKLPSLLYSRLSQAHEHRPPTRSHSLPTVSFYELGSLARHTKPIACILPAV